MSAMNAKSKLQGKIQYKFQNEALLESALIHPSTPGSRTADLAAGGFERLEFLGDRVLGLAIASLLLDIFPNAPEGELSKRHTALVRKEALVRIGKKINLSSVIQLAIGDGNAFARQKETAIADGVEALIGAIFLDGGYNPASKFVRECWKEMLDTVDLVTKDPKTTLQEWAQAHSLELPKYSIVNTEGSAHQPTFFVEVYIEGYPTLAGRGRSKRLAEQAAAEKMLASIGISTNQ
ncbi:MAG: ribonuclease III [Alphaproteobacteria bacterium]